MGFDKTKVVRAAEKYLAQGKIPAAIKEYRQIVEHDPDDFTALNMLGDLYVRTDKKQEAVTCFARIAEYYREQGFTPKAIAMYKKIDRLNPGTPEIASRLAALYEAQGLVVDARAQYLIIADAYARAGQTQKALEVLRKIADLDPHNIEIRLKLAEGYLRENFRSDAAEAYLEAGAQLYARASYERALEAYTKALDLKPHDRAALSGLVSTHIALGTADEAAEALERAVAEEPNDVELWSMLAHAYLEAEDAASAERVTTVLVTHEASSYTRFVDVARLYLKTGDTEAAARVVAGVAEQLLAGREEDVLTELLTEVLARDPEQVQALRLLVRLHMWQHDDEKLRAALERLAEAAEAADLVEEERHAMAQLARIAPDEPRYSERLQALGGAPDEALTESLYLSGRADEEIPTFESFMLAEEAVTTEADAPQEEAPAAEAVEFERNTVAPSAADASSSFADLNQERAEASSHEAAADSSTAAAAPPPASGFQEFDFSSAAAESAPPERAEGAADSPASSEARRETLLRQELESVDFYLAQGYTDIALDTLEMLERQFGAHAEIDLRRAELKKAGPPEAAVAQETPPAAASVEFSDFARYDVAEAPTETAAELNATFTETPPPPAAAAPAPPEALPTPAASEKSTAGIDPGLAAIFDEFRAAVEEEEHAPSDGDYETHYNLGLAYKEMDLVDEAVEEFQTAAALVAPQDGTPRFLQCCNLLGHCFMQKGMPRLAVMWFKKGLDAPGHTEDEYQALRYELGTAYEQMGDLDQAIDVFTEVYGINVSYRGVADKLRELQAQKASK